MIKQLNISCLRILIIYLVFSTLSFSFGSSKANAMFVTPTAVDSTVQNSTDMVKIKTFLELKIVQKRLSDFGFSGDEISNRLNQLSHDQLHHLATHIDGLDYGGDSGLSAVISILIITILVLVILQLTGHKVIIK
ncbi:MAG: PA2779 family protein [Nitrospira sp.]|nr:PA2779 family protein [Nitrospira sp.]